MGDIPVDEDLEALFDRISAQRGAPSPSTQAPTEGIQAAKAPSGESDASHVFERIGALTRQLHDSLRELGYDKMVHSAVEALPDARQRLAYIATLTGQAAERVLGAVEKAKGAQDALHGEATRLAERWEMLYAGELPVEAFRTLAGETRDFLKALPARTEGVNGCLHEVMMAQDFHDLTGQVIQRIVGCAQTLEEQLLKLLIDTAPPGKRPEAKSAWLNGPAMDRGAAEVIADQAQVDALLESLGF